MDRHLLQFKKVVEVGSINAAAAALYISQPALTQNMKKLEERVGIRLLDRTSRGVSTTEYGAVLYDHVKAMSNTYQQALDKIKILRHQKVFVIRIGSGHACWIICVKDALQKFHHKKPNASIHIEIGNNLYLYERSLSGHLDMFFGHKILGLDKKPGLEFIPLWQTTHCYFVRQEHPLAGQPVAYSDLDGYPWLEISHHDSRYLDYIKSVDQNPLEQERRRHDVARISTNSMTVGLTLLKSRDFVLPFVAEYAHILKARGIVKLDIKQNAIVEKVGVYVPEDNIKPETEEFIAFAQCSIGDFAPLRTP